MIADTGNDMIRVVAEQSGTFYGQSMTAGDIYTVAGDGKAGLSANGDRAANAALNNPENVQVDSSGNLLIAEGRNYGSSG